eukprot:2505148-Rhodomonas_salina.1
MAYGRWGVCGTGIAYGGACCAMSGPEIKCNPPSAQYSLYRTRTQLHLISPCVYCPTRCPVLA